MNNSEKAWKRNRYFGQLKMIEIQLINMLNNTELLVDTEIKELQEMYNTTQRILSQKEPRWEIFRKINKMGKYKDEEI